MGHQTLLRIRISSFVFVSRERTPNNRKRAASVPVRQNKSDTNSKKKPRKKKIKADKAYVPKVTSGTPEDRINVERQVREIIKSFYDPNIAAPIPRFIPGPVHPHYNSLTLRIDTDPGTYGAAIVRPDLIDTFSVYKEETRTGVLNASQLRLTPFQSSAVLYSIDYPLMIPGPPVVYLATKISAIPNATYFNASGYPHPGLIYFPGEFRVVDTTFPWVQYHNTDNGTVSVRCSLYRNCSSVATMVPWAQSAVTDIAGNATGNVTMTAMPGEGLTATDIAFCFEITNSVDRGHIPDGTTITQTSGSVAANQIEYEGTGAWLTSSALTLLDDAALLNLYQTASRISYTKTQTVLTDVTPTIYEGGSVCCAQITGDTPLPRNAEQLYDMISKLTTPMRVYKPGKLQRGASWNYVPEKLEDIQFHKQETYDNAWANDHRPYWVVAWQTPSVDNAKFTSMLNFGIGYEYLSNSIADYVCMSPIDKKDLYKYYLQLASQKPNVGENPDHLTRIRDVVKSIASDPDIRSAALNLMKTGGKSLLMAMPMLL